MNITTPVSKLNREQVIAWGTYQSIMTRLSIVKRDCAMGFIGASEVAVVMVEAETAFKLAMAGFKN